MAIKIGDRVRRLRTAKNLTQLELAKEIGSDSKYISAIESGRRNPGPNVMQALCTALGATEQVIRFGNEPPDDVRSAELRAVHEEVANLSLDELLEIRLLFRKWKRENQES